VWFRGKILGAILGKTPEGLENFPSPRTWEWLSLDLYEGFDSLEDIIGLVGEEVGRKFDAFRKLKVDIDDLINNPGMFSKLDFDAKYMVPIMLANWISQHKKDFSKAFPLIDAMASDSHEFVVMLVISMKKRVAVKFLKALFAYNSTYRVVSST